MFDKYKPAPTAENYDLYVAGVVNALAKRDATVNAAYAKFAAKNAKTYKYYIDACVLFNQIADKTTAVLCAGDNYCTTTVELDVLPDLIYDQYVNIHKQTKREYEQIVEEADSEFFRQTGEVLNPHCWPKGQLQNIVAGYVRYNTMCFDKIINAPYIENVETKNGLLFYLP